MHLHNNHVYKKCTQTYMNDAHKNIITTIT